ncbi:benzylsuccinate synthase activating enzyme [Clostridium tepidiprofundi DSM 19306]|uniref:Benzylsuccinate synthase activating enzyme n=1 Tax=Clostridium tepidiprofundi DSM 19306 TaxID=1121338 RepID=A0A151B681_9CLOT|nr:YjjW family glycine radical enzyme activase [Clostridium tepidiprofundi]KYH35445.1 benzylsuccinate synthase activating enzyme [Clostridium tepidiprofundi DSM 19306]
MIDGLVNKILPFSSVDGPGNRTSIFLQGCNFNCLYCHNPETINICNNCGICVKECPYEALKIMEGNVVWDKNKCHKCGKCLEICPRDSSPKVQKMSVEDIVDEIKKTKAFISGVTISGGECTRQLELLTSVCEKVKSLGLTVFLDTNGSMPFYENEKLVEVIDKVMLDVKAFDVKEHYKLTGKSNDIVLKNLKYLGKINKLYEVRTVIVPDILDNEKNVFEISNMIASINPDIRYKLIKYRPIGVRNHLINSYSPSDEIMNKLFRIAKRNKCKNVIIV